MSGLEPIRPMDISAKPVRRKNTFRYAMQSKSCDNGRVIAPHAESVPCKRPVQQKGAFCLFQGPLLPCRNQECLCDLRLAHQCQSFLNTVSSKRRSVSYNGRVRVDMMLNVRLKKECSCIKQLYQNHRLISCSQSSPELCHHLARSVREFALSRL
jgi:hypothetical protein